MGAEALELGSRSRTGTRRRWNLIVASSFMKMPVRPDIEPMHQSSHALSMDHQFRIADGEFGLRLLLRALHP